MSLALYSLNHIHAFAVGSRHLNMTLAADELCVTQAAVSHQSKIAGGQRESPTTSVSPSTDSAESSPPPLRHAGSQKCDLTCLSFPGPAVEPTLR